ncbi:YgfZ/GcvT domain-containing protein [Prosthecomicrobium pneumaticum]|uniref:CAF17 C-terminal domain-containing protein n=1 Tax=Prosthecomicrobium pneumaticum TaxID=81895 RepID=A0A7W9FKZ3_9HYPH|nr:folate-binding protein YgfZ [Prosthecomicrobium pneumaticum]MBB5751948.1 hypothetical protein [Prosthecomicrobium pneumaticum]
MREGSIAQLADRAVVSIGGPDAFRLLDDLVTNAMAQVAADGIGFGALLSPQGKILVDFLVHRAEDGFLFDLAADRAAEFVKRMTLYRLRARMTIEDRSAALAVWAAFGGGDPGAPFRADPRLAALGFRAVLPRDAAPPVRAGYEQAPEESYHAHRIALAVPEGGRDFAFGETFPHEADMDCLGGVDFRKGCYVGQEIVSRMEHRGTARRRALAVSAPQPLPPAGAPLTAGGRPVGTMGSSTRGRGIAIVRLDRAKAAADDGTTIRAGEATVALALPAFARFGWPEEAGPEEPA